MLATDATSVFISSLNILKLRKLLRRSNNLIVMHAENYLSCKGLGFQSEQIGWIYINVDLLRG